MKKIAASLSLFLFLSLFAWAWLNFSGSGKKFRSSNSSKKETALVIDHNILEKLQGKATEASLFVQKNNYNNRICFLIDMSLPSGKARFFVYDLQKDTIQNAGLVTHGRCNQNWLEGRKYSNIPGCGCTSLGK